jgi:glycosyltransferase involved in cell wall biosynthesis
LKKIAIISTHPIQYNAPLFRLLTERKQVTIKVFYTWGVQAAGDIYDPGFGKTRQWDIPLLSGYDYHFVKNESTLPGSHHYKGIVNPDLVQQIDLYQPSAILVFGWSFKSHLQVLRHFKGKVPVLFRGDSTLLDELAGLNLKKIARRLFLKWVYSHIDFALYVGSNNKAYFKAHGVDEDKLVYAPHAIDNHRFQDRAAEKEEAATVWKKELDIPAEKISILFAGKLDKKKNPLFLVEAAPPNAAVSFHNHREWSFRNRSKECVQRTG